MSSANMLIFSLDPECGIARALAATLELSLAPHEDRGFEDGEHKLRPLVDPRGGDAYVVCSLHGGPIDSPHDKLCKLLMLASALHDHGADRVTAVVPYLAYARKDRQTKAFDPLGQRMVAQLFEAVGIAQVIALEVHNPAAFQNAFRIPTIHLPAQSAFDAWVETVAAQGPLAVVSPDPGGVKRVLLWREALADRLGQPVGFAMVDKRRSSGVVSSAHLVAGDVDSTTVLLYDDLIATGTTMVRAAAALRRAGARDVLAVAAHGLFVPPAADVLSDAAVSAIVVTDSVPPFRLPPDGPVARKLRVMPAAATVARAIGDSHRAWLR